MLQRIQTIYLFLASCCWLVFGFLPSYYSQGSPSDCVKIIEFLPYCQFISLSLPYYNFIPLIIRTFGILTILLNFIAIFFYKKRNLQIKICIAAIISFVCFALSFAYKYFSVSITLYSSILLPVISLVFTILAIKAIKKDEKLINSADRLR